jgi:hypothetical protein
MAGARTPITLSRRGTTPGQGSKPSCQCRNNVTRVQQIADSRQHTAYLACCGAVQRARSLPTVPGEEGPSQPFPSCVVPEICYSCVLVASHESQKSLKW